MNVVIVPTRNEERSVAPLIESLHRVGLRTVIVVDESDTDRTRRRAEAAGAIALWTCGGIGPSIVTGFRWAMRHSDVTRFVVVDAGFSHSPVDAWRVLNATGDIVVGSRFLFGSRYIGRPFRARASRWYSRACSIRTGYPVSDWTSGLRAYSRAAAASIVARPITAKMHAWQAEALVVAHKAGFQVNEIPVSYCAGTSSLSRTGIREAMHLLRRMPW